MCSCVCVASDDDGDCAILQQLLHAEGEGKNRANIVCDVRGTAHFVSLSLSLSLSLLSLSPLSLSLSPTLFRCRRPWALSSLFVHSTSLIPFVRLVGGDFDGCNNGSSPTHDIGKRRATDCQLIRNYTERNREFYRMGLNQARLRKGKEGRRG